MSTDDVDTSANDLGGAEDMLSPMESTDSDEVLNADGDEVVDPPEDWSGVTKNGMTAEEEREGESLDQRLAEEVPDVTPDDIKAIAPDVLRHRVLTTYEAEAEEVTSDEIVRRVLATVESP